MISEKQKRSLILILVIVLACAIVFLGYAISIGNSNLDDGRDDSNIDLADGSIVDNSLPNEPTDEAKIDSSKVNPVLLGQNDLGTVEVLGPFGNPNSHVKIAYSIGMHPWESKVHKALFDTILAKNSSLDYSHYIYKINVTNSNAGDEGRMDGQLLAQEFVVPDIINGNYSLFLDIHSNKGTVGGSYEKTNFVFAVGQDEKSERFVNQILDRIDELDYYFPNDQSSPPYITLPTQQAGIPTVNYETYSYESPKTTYDLVNKLVDAVDSLEF